MDEQRADLLQLRTELNLSEAQIDELRDANFPEWRERERACHGGRDTWPFYSFRVDSDETRRFLLAAAPPRVDVAISVQPKLSR